MPDLVLLKLGGSVITDKSSPETAREDVVRRLGQEIRQALAETDGMRLVIGHGSGSFGHSVAHRYHTHSGVVDDQSWYGLAETSRAAARLNRLVTDWLFEAGLPVISFQPSASALCCGRRLLHLELEPLRRALAGGLIPIVYGDVAMDLEQGFAIISTEQIFSYLVAPLGATRIVLAGIVDGVYTADPLRHPDSAQRLDHISPRSWAEVRALLGGSHAVDVTGGMLSKVEAMVDLVECHPDLTVTVVSGAIPGRVQQALRGDVAAGTRIGTTAAA
jgi:isopentenyl phosphate kinase